MAILIIFKLEKSVGGRVARYAQGARAGGWSSEGKIRRWCWQSSAGMSARMLLGLISGARPMRRQGRLSKNEPSCRCAREKCTYFSSSAPFPQLAFSDFKNMYTFACAAAPGPIFGEPWGGFQDVFGAHSQCSPMRCQRQSGLVATEQGAGWRVGKPWRMARKTSLRSARAKHDESALVAIGCAKRAT